MAETNQKDRMKHAQYISDKVKKLRDAARWSQSELARRAEVTGAAISQIEKGRRIPSMVVTRKLAETLNVSVSELTGDSMPSSADIDDKAQAFFRSYGDIDELCKDDQKIILSIIKSMKEKK